MATHIASPHSTREQVPSTTQEDIGSVLERFHKWAGHQAEPIRELSYEEAVARSRRRVYVEDDPVGPQPVKAAAAPIPAPPPPIPFPVVKEPPASKPGAEPSGTASANSAKTAKPVTPPASPKARPQKAKADSAEAKAAPAEPAKKAASRKKSASAKPRTAQKKSAQKPTAEAAKSEAATQEISVPPSPNNFAQNAAPAAAMEAANSPSATAASAYAEVRLAADAPEANPLPQATFAQVLTAQIQSTAAGPADASKTEASQPTAAPVARVAPALTKRFAVAPLPDDAPAVHLTVRLASDEREGMRERARDLGITPSAYVRQCALEVDSLRIELDHARLAQAQVAAELERAHEEVRSAKSEAALCLTTRTVQRRDKESEWFTRLRNFVFPRKAKGQAFATRA